MSETASKLSPEVLRELLSYNPETGALTWMFRERKWFAADNVFARWNTRYANKPAFTWIDRHGYAQGAIFDRHYVAHRVIWAMQTGAWPTAHVDHINGDRGDNRWDNLREASHMENCRNRRASSNSTSKYLGVCWNKQAGKWRARINVDGAIYNLGDFASEEVAAKVYDVAARHHFGQFARPNFPLDAA